MNADIVEEETVIRASGAIKFSVSIGRIVSVTVKCVVVCTDVFTVYIYLYSVNVWIIFSFEFDPLGCINNLDSRVRACGAGVSELKFYGSVLFRCCRGVENVEGCECRFGGVFMSISNSRR